MIENNRDTAKTTTMMAKIKKAFHMTSNPEWVTPILLCLPSGLSLRAVITETLWAFLLPAFRKTFHS